MVNTTFHRVVLEKVVRNSLEENVEVDFIAKITRLSVERILELKEKYGL